MKVFLVDVSICNVLLKPELGGAPRVYYKNIPKTFIGGTVYDPKRSEIIEGAALTLRGPNGENLTAQTNGWGDFWFDGLEGGVYSLEIRAQGYPPRRFTRISTVENSVNLGDVGLR